jgi:hypothetical protein
MTTILSIILRGMHQSHHVPCFGKMPYHQQALLEARPPMPAGRYPSQFSIRRQVATLAPVQRPNVLSISRRA